MLGGATVGRDAAGGHGMVGLAGIRKYKSFFAISLYRAPLPAMLPVPNPDPL